MAAGRPMEARDINARGRWHARLLCIPNALRLAGTVIALYRKQIAVAGAASDPPAAHLRPGPALFRLLSQPLPLQAMRTRSRALWAFCLLALATAGALAVRPEPAAATTSAALHIGEGADWQRPWFCHNLECPKVSSRLHPTACCAQPARAHS